MNLSIWILTFRSSRLSGGVSATRYAIREGSGRRTRKGYAQLGWSLLERPFGISGEYIIYPFPPALNKREASADSVSEPNHSCYRATSLRQ